VISGLVWYSIQLVLKSAPQSEVPCSLSRSPPHLPPFLSLSQSSLLLASSLSVQVACLPCNQTLSNDQLCKETNVAS
jgi:hypothetical protein